MPGQKLHGDDALLHREPVAGLDRSSAGEFEGRTLVDLRPEGQCGGAPANESQVVAVGLDRAETAGGGVARSRAPVDAREDAVELAAEGIGVEGTGLVWGQPRCDDAVGDSPENLGIHAPSLRSVSVVTKGCFHACG